MNGWMVLMAGAMVGLGVATIAAALVPNRPSLRAALSRLDAGPQDAFLTPRGPSTGRFVVPVHVVGRPLAVVGVVNATERADGVVLAWRATADPVVTFPKLISTITLFTPS